MNKCSKCTPYPVCDFCKHFNFNGENGVYIDKGWCNKFNERKDPEDGRTKIFGKTIECEEFYCRMYDRENEQNT